MLVRIVNRWTYKGNHYVPGDLIEMPEELLTHIFEVSGAEEVTNENTRKVYNAIVNDATISEAVKETINLRADEEKTYFTLSRMIDDREVKMFYQVPKDPEVRIVS